MYIETPKKIVLTGELGSSEMSKLAAYCDRLRATGQVELQVDVTEVVDCHRAGLDGLHRLVAGEHGLAVRVGGAHWAQFMTMLGSAPVVDVRELCDSARELIHGRPGSDADRSGRRAAPRHRAPVD